MSEKYQAFVTRYILEPILIVFGMLFYAPYYLFRLWWEKQERYRDKKNREDDKKSGRIV